MITKTAEAIQWNLDRQQDLQRHLIDAWAADVWTFRPKLHVKRQHAYTFRFTCTSPTIRTEVKYALWCKFDRGEWQREMGDGSLVNAVNVINAWLSQVAPQLQSLLEKPLEYWELSLRGFLMDQEIYTPKVMRMLHSSQTYREYVSEDRRIGLFRQIYSLLCEVYDDRLETDKDVWNFRALGVEFNPTVSLRHLNFTGIHPLWLRELAKAFARYNIAVHTPSDSLNKVQSLTLFGRFAQAYAPFRQRPYVDRSAIVAYLQWMVTQGYDDQFRLKELGKLKSTFTVCAHQLDLPTVSKEVLFLRSDFPKQRRPLPRELPEEVLDQLRQHLHALPTFTLRMVVILLECGLRISELCTLRPDCLICDDKHEWYLRLYQLKSKKEHVIPLVNDDVVAAIQAQQQEIRGQYGPDWPCLFPRPRNPRQPYHQMRFAAIINAWAVEHEIRDRTGKLWRFQSHQFRHTVGMRLINDNVPMEVISRLLGHDSMHMTQHYARKRAENVRQELLRVQQHRRTVDYQGQVVQGDPRANDADAQLLRKGIRGQTLLVGGCGRLMMTGPCEHANKCLTCPFWLTTTEDLPALKTFHAKGIRLRMRATEVGNDVVVANQDRILPSLALRIAALEQPDHAATSVTDLVAQLHADKAELETALEEAREANVVLAMKRLEHDIADLHATIIALEATS